MSCNVLHLRSSGGVLGAENVIVELCRFSADFGFLPIIGAIRDRGDPYPEFLTIAKEKGINTVLFECNGKFDLTLFKQIRKFVKNENIHILHCHGYKEDFYAIFSFADVLKIATNHLWKRTSFSLKMYAFIDSFILSCFNGVVGVSDEIVNEMQKKGIKNCIKINNGVDTIRFDYCIKSQDWLTEYGLPSDSIILGMISSLTIEKGHIYAIQSLKLLNKINPKIKLVIAGEGKNKKLLEILVKKMGLENDVFFIGKQSDIPKLLSVFDIFLLPSLVEGLPMALLEAMACKKYIIATNVGEIPRVISHGVNGVLINHSNVNDLKDAILHILSKEVKDKNLGDNARQTVMDKYSSKKMAGEYCAFYELIMRNIKNRKKVKGSGRIE